MWITSGDALGAPRAAASACLRILFLVSAHNGLSQRAEIALGELGHSVTVEVVETGEEMERAVERGEPQLIVCPFLKKMIPESIWTRHRCLIVHPGPLGDRGPSSLDWAIELGTPEWGVTVLEANGEFDAGAVWATRTFDVREAPKSSLYRHEVRHAAIAALIDAVDRIAHGAGRPRARFSGAHGYGRVRPLMVQSDRKIDWGADGTESVLRKLRAAEGQPGVLDTVAGIEFYLFGGHRESVLHGRPGEVIAQRTGAICRATVDGAVWITHLKRRDTRTGTFFKLPAVRALELAGRHLDVPEVVSPSRGAVPADRTYREIVYEERAGVGYLRFEFYNGAMSTEQCERLHEAYLSARGRALTKVIVLMGGRDYFSNGIHLNLIEAAEDAAEESWRNLRAIDDVVHEIIATESHLVLSALAGDAGAGGVPLALAADYVVARDDVVLNPYYRHMGGLYGSEYWTYLLPRRVGVKAAALITTAPFRALGAREAVQLGLLDDAFGATWDEFHVQTRVLAERLANDRRLPRWLEHKRRQRARDEQIKPLQAYRDEELARCHECFFGPDPSYHRARGRFVYKLPASRRDPGVLTPAPGEPVTAGRFRPAGGGHRLNDHNRYQMRGRAR
jgi:putative two-component system protein, hydrogenase maturation factor HypX/HoxX